MSADQFKVVLGLDNPSASGNGQVYNVDSVVLHPQFACGSGFFLFFPHCDYDLALLHLTVPAGTAFSPILLQSAAVSTGTAAAVIGYGAAVSNGVGSGLQEIQNTVLDASSCQESLPSLFQYAFNSDRMMCAGSSTAPGPCHGDSGGPLMVQQQGRYILAGVVSHGTSVVDLDPCGSIYNGVYMKVSAFLQWIASIAEPSTNVAAVSSAAT